MVAFNKSIATELQQRVPPGVDAMTLHSLGYKTVQSSLGRQQPNSFVVQDAIAEIEQKDIREIRKHDFDAIRATEKLTSLVKQNLIGWDGEAFSVDSITNDDLYRLAAHYDVELNGSASKTFGWVRECLERALNPSGKITFDDMIWLPIVLNLGMSKYDLLFVDEAQDLNRCQQELALKAGNRLIFCGDDRQAIYGFAGADSESLKRLETKLGESSRGVVVLPLTVTRRCGKAIVEEARKIVPDFEAYEGNGEGSIGRAKLAEGNSNNGLSDEGSYRGYASSGDMVLCRVNAPLVSECFKFIKGGVKATGLRSGRAGPRTPRGPS
jgi:DNA helicase-2/ATP-dependent DNA helicase PcrA